MQNCENKALLLILIILQKKYLLDKIIPKLLTECLNRNKRQLNSSRNYHEEKKMIIDVASGLLNQARQCPSPNYNERPESCGPSLIIIHNISLPPHEFGGPWIDQLFTNNLDVDFHPFFREIGHLRVASHLLIRRDGEIVQYVPFHLRAFHAGLSRFQGRDSCNDFSIGIELEGTDFVPFADIQYFQLIRVLRALCASYPELSPARITGHEHVAPGRKTDPGPCFDWQLLSAELGVCLPAAAQAVPSCE